MRSVTITFLRVIGLILVVISWVCLTVGSINYNRYCAGYLKRAADANTIELAKDNLAVAVSYAKSNGMTDGNSSLFWSIPSNDFKFWYDNLSSSLHELETIPTTATQLEKTNVLMKLRETLLDNDTSSGTSITAPRWCSVYPYQWLVCGLSIIGVMMLANDYVIGMISIIFHLK